MPTEYTETMAPEGDAEGRILETLAEGNPYVFIVAKFDEDANMNLRAAVGGGISSVETIKELLRKTLWGMPS